MHTSEEVPSDNSAVPHLNNTAMSFMVSLECQYPQVDLREYQ